MMNEEPSKNTNPVITLEDVLRELQDGPEDGSFIYVMDWNKC